MKNACGIVVDNEDTGAITGFDAGGAIVKTAESIVPETGKWKYPSSTSFKIQGLTVKVPAKNTLSSSEQFIVGALYSWWIDESLTLIKNSFGLTFNETDTSVNSITIQFYNKNDGNMAITNYGTGQKTKSLTLKINMHYYTNIDKSNPNGDANAITYLDRTIVHEMTHAVMAANIDYFSNLPTVFKEGSAELVHGIDDKRYSNLVKLASNSTDLKKAFSSSGTNTYTAGYMVLRYLAKQASNNSATIIRGTSKNDTLKGTANSDIFWLTAGNGNDVIVDFKSGNDNDSDIINLENVGKFSINRNNGVVKLNFDKGGSVKINTENNVDKAIQYTFDAQNIINAKIGNTTKSNTFTYDGDVDVYFGGKGRDTLTLTDNTGDNEIWLADETFNSIEVINAKNTTGNNFMAGDSAANVIYGGKGKSTLWGGEGTANDTLFGGSGDNVFWYGLNEGNDIIRNAKNTDVVKLYNVRLDDITFAGKSGSNFVVNAGSGSLKIVGKVTPTFQFADGSNWKYDFKTQNWSRLK